MNAIIEAVLKTTAAAAFGAASDFIGKQGALPTTKHDWLAMGAAIVTAEAALWVPSPLTALRAQALRKFLDGFDAPPAPNPSTTPEHHTP